MPTYAYACTQCGHAFDAVQSFSEASLTVCPECGGALRKQYGSIGVTFNGGGFYRTDSRASATKGSADSSASSGATGTSAPSSTSGGTSSATTAS
ncbi:hypothetical protein GCM10009860_20170 [Microbacterium mitrae]|uniref:FmdB family transcriptional regulator n=1 Tax=Microbacterium mitrae TaxID=664640 RepID=A0A5C8HNV1_9MICO|nr:FmdB family zinc ribbon protein [Microbacterium mitrae]TXK04474.1 FmdB family transcriptional regulator [Microbacterium mitrae]